MNKNGLMRENYQIINWIRQKSLCCVLAVMVFIYSVINIIFGVLYYHQLIHDQFVTYQPVVEQGTSSAQEHTSQVDGEQDASSTQKYSIFHCVYFSFITAATIGYGDFYPTVSFGKTLVIIQSIFCSVYIAIMMSIITSKIMWASVHTVFFSEQIVYNKEHNIFEVRVINTNSLPIINPEVQITLTQHQIGDVIAGVLTLDSSCAKPTYLGRHDFVMRFGIQPAEAEKIYGELKKALCYEGETDKNRSRFKITITISGCNGIQNIAELKKYHAKDFVEGTGFAPIRYGGKDDDYLGLKYYRIQGFWQQFEAIKNKKTI